jgi:4-hydroxy-2-oxoheptanedioate aldolase
MKDLKKRLRQGETLTGCWLNIGSPLTAEMVGLAGFDWVLIDLEHGAGTEADVLHQLQAIEHTPAAPVIRVESFERQRIHRVLDLGAEGIMCPRINSPGEAHRFTDGLAYPPAGVRGVAKMVRATNFGSDFNSYYKNQQEDILGIVQVETAGILNHLDEIAAIENVDVLFIGPLDLSMALGIFGQFDHPLFVSAVKATVEAAEVAGKAAGILLLNADDIKKYIDLGIRFIACGSDSLFVVNGARDTALKLNSLKKSKNQSKQ